MNHLRKKLNHIWEGPTSFSPCRVTRYFTIATLTFIAAFLLFPTSKMVNNVYYLFLMAPALILLPRLWRERRASWLSALWVLFFLYHIVLGVSQANLGYLKDILYVLTFIFIITHLISADVFDSDVIIRALFWSAIGYVLINALWLWTSGSVEIGQRVLTLSGRMSGPIYTSMWIASCFALASIVWIRNGRLYELGLATFAALFTCGFILQSRSGLLGILLGLLCIGAYSVRGTRVNLRNVIIFGTLTLLCLGAALLWIPGLSSLWERGDSFRFQLWEYYLQLLRDCGLWLGCGLDYSSNITLANGGGIYHPHNIFLSLAMYTGVLGAGIFLILLLAIIANAIKYRRLWGAPLALGMIMLNFDGHRIINSPSELWLLILLPAGLATIGNTASTRRQREK